MGPLCVIRDTGWMTNQRLRNKWPAEIEMSKECFFFCLKRWPDVGPRFAHRLRRWANITPTFHLRLVFSGEFLSVSDWRPRGICLEQHYCDVFWIHTAYRSKQRDIVSWIHSCPAESFAFEAGIAKAISNFKRRKIFIFMKNRQLQYWIIGLTKHPPTNISAIAMLETVHPLMLR